MLRLIQSNDIDVLAAHLLHRADAVREPGLAAERFVVPSLGFARWLQWRIADTRGICANVEFSFPAQFIWNLFARVLPDIPQRSPFDGEVMTLRLFGLLRQLPDDADHAPLNAWLAVQDSRGRLELAEQIARLFQNYLAYRPDWLEAWGQNRLLGLDAAGTERWQKQLWRRLLDAEPVGGPRHPKEAVFAELARCRAAGESLDGLLPREIRIIGVPALPPLYLDIFAELANYTEVAIWFLNPCRQYWGDIASEARRARLALAGEAALPELGHPLLASWGRQSREQFVRFAALGNAEGVQDAGAYLPAEGDRLLARLKRSMLDLAPLPQWSADDPDDSIEIHACHSLTRQCEVLHDALLRHFEADPTLRPQDVLVLAPDIDEAAPVIDAVFGTAAAARHLPYSISGRAATGTQPLGQALTRLLRYAESRFEAAEALDLLRLPPIARALSLDEADTAQLSQWLSEAGVRWGRDAAQREALNLPASARHSWAEGLQRLLLGYAQPAGHQRLVAGLMPYDEVEGSDALLIGRLLRALQALVALAEQCARPRAPAAWSEFLLQTLDRLIVPGPEDHAEDRRLREALVGLADDARRADCREPVPLSVVLQLFEQRLDADAPGGVAGGRITFTGLQPLRGLPFRHVCFIGLDDGAYPRNPSPLEFDLALRHPRPGDRIRRDEDRGAFLDALNAAGEAVWIGYTGRSQRDNAVLPPSVLVAELLDALGSGIEGGRRAAERALLTEHPLQAFSPRYFDGSLPRSHAVEFLGAAEAASRPPLRRDRARPMFDAPLPEAPPEWRELSLERLIGFLRNPARFLLRERLGLRLAVAGDVIPGEEPFLIARGDDARLSERLLALRLAGTPAAQAAALLAHAPELPHGEPGRQTLAAEMRRIEALIAQRPAREALPPLSYDIEIDGFRLVGSLTDLAEDGLLRLSVRDYGWREWLELWPRHLMLNLLAPAGVERRSRLIAGRRQEALGPRDDAREQLAALLQLYWRGLHYPSGYAPRSAAAYMEKQRKLAEAEKVWRGGFNPGENADPWQRQLYGGLRDALPDGFETAAECVLGPLYPTDATS